MADKITRLVTYESSGMEISNEAMFLHPMLNSLTCHRHRTRPETYANTQIPAGFFSLFRLFRMHRSVEVGAKWFESNE